MTRTAFFGGLPYETTEEEFTQWLSDEANLSAEEIVSLKIPKWADSGRARGYALVEVADEDGLNKCLAANKKNLGTRYIEVKESQPREERTGGRRHNNNSSNKLSEIPESCRLLFVKNLPYETSEEEVEERFKEYGEVESVRLGRWNNTGRLKGFGYVEFKQNSTLRRVLKITEPIELSGRKLHLDFETNNKPKGSFRDTQGKLWSKDN